MSEQIPGQMDVFDVLEDIERNGASERRVRFPGVREALDRGESLIAVKADKRPWYPWKAFQTERASAAQLEQWARDRRAAAFAVITGALSKIVVLDFDDEDGIRLLERLGLEPHVRTGGGGYHVRLAHPGRRVATQNSEVTQLLHEKWHGLDIRGDGGYAIEWGASELGEYTALRDLADLVAIEALPEELAVDLRLVKAAPSATPAPRRRATVTHPGRHAHLHKIGSAMRGKGEQEAAILAELRRVNAAECDPPKDDADVVKLAADIAGRYPRGGPAGDRERDDPAVELRQRLTVALKIGAADLEVTGAEVFGTRGPYAACAINLRHRPTGEVITLEVGRYSQLLQGPQLSGLVAAWTGVGETFAPRECAMVAGLVTRLAAHENTTDENQIAEDWGMAWLYAAEVLDVDLENQGERWAAICHLKDRDPVMLARADHRSIAAHSVDLRDAAGDRYVHSAWFAEFVRRDCSGHLGAPELYSRMQRVGWLRRGRRSRLKATEPDGAGVLFLPFFLVPASWETRQ